MTLVKHPAVEVGFVRRVARVYREKRQPVPIYKTDALNDGLIVRKGFDRAPRWACLQIAWHQALNARDRAVR